MRFLFVVFPEPGHLNPMVAVAQHLVHAGHAVEFFSMEDLSARLAAAGLGVRCHVAGETATVQRSTRGRDFTARLARPAFAARWYQYVLVNQVPAQLVVLREVVRTFRPDAIVTDPLAYVGAIIGEQERVPWAGVSTQLIAIAPRGFACPYLEYLEALAPHRERLLAVEGVTLRFKSSEAISPWLNTVFATEALVPRERADNQHSVFVGPSRPLGRRGDEAVFPWERLRGDRPLVYAAFGSQLAPPDAVFEALGTALDVREAEIVLAYGDPGVLPSLPDHVIAVPWAPQQQLLAKAACMVSHGGANSFAECLTSGKPLLVIPLGHEQPLQARLAEQSGVGLALAPEDVTPPRMAEALRTLLADGVMRRRSAEIERSYAVTDGARRTAELLLELAEQRQPIRPVVNAIA